MTAALNTCTNLWFFLRRLRKNGNLAYNYGDSNRLKKVTETSLATKGFKYANSGNARDFDYDKNGNLVADRNKGITNIQYNYLNLPQVITFAGNRILTFIYDANGAKLRKIVNNNGTVDTYDYVNGVEYKNNVLQRISHTEGAVVRQTDGSYLHEYVLRDHLGNTRVTFSDGNNDRIVVSGDIKQINHYYPFGLNMEGNWNGAKGDNKYGYNGKEWNDDFGLGWNDYGARFYDAAVARWGNIDPLSEKYSKWSPYNYTMNNPIKYIDPNGKDIIITIAGGQNLPKGEKFESVKYGGDGKLYDVISGKEYTGTNSYFRETQATLNKLNDMGGEVKEVVDDLLKNGDTHTIAMNNGLPSKDDPTGAKGSYTVRDGGQSRNTLTRFVPNKDKANGSTFSKTEILGHEMKHAFNIKNNKDNSNLTLLN